MIHFALQLMKRAKTDLFLSDLYYQNRFTFYDFGLKHLKILCLLLFSVPVSRYSTMKSCLPRREDRDLTENLLTKLIHPLVCQKSCREWQQTQNVMLSGRYQFPQGRVGLCHHYHHNHFQKKGKLANIQSV